MSELDTVIRLAVAGVAGLAIGVEREWSGHATGPRARFAGVRTFLVLGIIGGLAGWFIEMGWAVVAASLLLAASALVVAAYVSASRRAPDAIDGTTEAAAILVLATGTLAGLGSLRIASGIAAVTVLALGEKHRIQEFLKRIDEAEMKAALQFAVLALVILPLLPEGPYGPWGGIKPRELWTVVLLFSGLNFLGYLARQAWGAASGYQVMGALGGLVSSTLVTLNFSRQSQRERDNAFPLAVGVVAASTVLNLRLLGVILILTPALVPSAALGLAPMFVTGVGLIVIGRRHLAGGKPVHLPPEPANPLQLGSAIKMALAFQVVLTLFYLVSRRFGDQGVLASAAIVGLTDMDALALSMTRLAKAPEMIALAAQGLTLGVLVNNLFKTGLAVSLGTTPYRRLAVPGMLALSVAGGVGFWLVEALLR